MKLALEVLGLTVGLVSLMAAAPAAVSQNPSSSPSPESDLCRFSSCSEYLVVLRRGSNIHQDDLLMSEFVTHLQNAYNVNPRHIWKRALLGLSVTLPASATQELLSHPSVSYVELNGPIQANATQSNPTWGLDRIDQFSLPLSASYTYTRTGTGVHAYVVDTGIRATHTEFTGRIGAGFDAIGDGGGTNDCNGHGTHVAGTLGGTVYGVAKGVVLHPVQVLDCLGNGTWDSFITGLDWVIENSELPAVMNASLGGGYNQVANDAVEATYAAGIVVVVAAGNSGSDACSYSPASAPSALAIGSIDSTDTRASTSNYGKCVDSFAPGVNITSAYIGSDSDTEALSGTSMASPHVAGIVALYQEQSPSATATSAFDHVIGKSTFGKVLSKGSQSPNHLAYSTEVSNDRKPLYSYWNSSGGDTNYTPAWHNLKGGSDAYLYKRIEGYLYTSGGGGRSAVRRWWNSGSVDHHLLLDPAVPAASGYVKEGVLGYSAPSSSSTKPIYRYWSISLTDHLFTSDWSELEDGNETYVYEGTPFYLLKSR